MADLHDQAKHNRANTLAPNSAKGDLVPYLVRQDTQTGRWNVVGKTNGVTTKNAFVNGITGTLQDHANSGGRLIQAQLGKGVTEYTLFNNPSKGILADIWETARDKLGFTTAPARTLAGTLQGVQSSGSSVNWVAHSQGGAIFAEAMRYAGGNLSANSVTFNAGANNAWVTNRIASSVGVHVNGYSYSSWDAVPNAVGLNGNPLEMAGSIAAAPLLFIPSASTHSNPTKFKPQNSGN